LNPAFRLKPAELGAGLKEDRSIEGVIFIGDEFLLVFVSLLVDDPNSSFLPNLLRA